MMSETPIELLWQSDLLIAACKPAGLLTQAPAGIDSLESKLSTQLDRHDGYLAFPHRLDRQVSGVVLVALTKKAARLLSAQFASRKTAKHYLAVVEGEISSSAEPELRWEDFIRKIDSQPMAESCRETDPNAKLARTIATPLQYDAARNQTKLALRPITGRMHQLRLQSSLRGHPIVGDVAYGANPIASDDASSESVTHSLEACSAGSGPDVIGGDRILLHAHRLGFFDPKTGLAREIEAPCPF